MAYASWSVVFGEQPSAAKWNILGTNDAYFNTTLDATTKFVGLVPAVSVVNADPAGTTWTSVDITANTSATAFAALVQYKVLSASSVSRIGYIRQTGSAAAQDDLTTVVVNQVVNVASWASTIVKLDSSQSFDWSVSNADVSNATIILRGYWQTLV